MSAATVTPSFSYRPVHAKNNAPGALQAPKSKPVVKLATCDKEGIAAFNAAIDRQEHKTFADLDRIIKAAHGKILCTKEKMGACMLFVHLQAVVEVIQDGSAFAEQAQVKGGVVVKCDKSAQTLITRAVQHLRASMNKIPEQPIDDVDDDIEAEDVNFKTNPDLHNHLTAVHKVAAADEERECTMGWSAASKSIKKGIGEEIVERLIYNLLKETFPISKKTVPATAAALAPNGPTPTHQTAATPARRNSVG